MQNGPFVSAVCLSAEQLNAVPVWSNLYTYSRYIRRFSDILTRAVMILAICPMQCLQLAADFALLFAGERLSQITLHEFKDAGKQNLETSYTL